MTSFKGVIKYNTRVVRFRRKGHKRYPLYEIVLALRKSRSRGKFLEKLGFFNPNFSERLFFFDVGRFAYWRNRGIKINFSVKRVLVKLLHHQIF